MSSIEFTYVVEGFLALLIIICFIQTNLLSDKVKKQDEKISQLDFSNKLFISIDEPTIPESRYTMRDEKSLLDKVEDAIKEARSKNEEHVALNIERMKKAALLHDTKRYYNMLNNYCKYLDNIGKIKYK